MTSIVPASPIPGSPVSPTSLVPAPSGNIDLTLEQVAHHIGVIEVALGVTYPMPVSVAAEALLRWYPMATWPVATSALVNLRDRYLGQHENLPSLAQQVALNTISHPNFAVWPYSRIDWAAAGNDLARSIENGRIVEILDHYWFIAP